MGRLTLILTLTVVVLAAGACAPSGGAQRLPNIVFIFADDLGYGDVGAFNPDSKIATPHIDRLAREGIRLTDAHASGPVCVPSRYGLITGRYMFRTPRSFREEALIEPGRVTIASLLKGAGYATAMIGKWHLGFEEPFASYASRMFQNGKAGREETFDYGKPLRGGPVDHGFDSYFGMHASLDVPPYFFIENDRVVEAATATVEERHTNGVRFIQGEFWRGGPISPGFKHAEVLPRFSDRAVKYIDGRAGSQEPFFLYLALTAPHPPWLPTEPFRGKSGAGMYGDFVVQVDDVVGRVASALEKAGKAGDTLLIFTSDNGPTWYDADIQKYGHRAVGNLRGMKADAWEGGHRIPFIARWPGKIRAGTSSAQLVCFTDMLATFASITGQKLPEGAGEDSFDVLPVLLGPASEPIRQAIIHESAGPEGQLAIRQGEWKLIPWAGEVSVFERFPMIESDGKVTQPPTPTPQPDGQPGQLYNLASDPGERKNLYAEHPEVVQRLTELLDRYRREGRSRPN